MWQAGVENESQAERPNASAFENIHLGATEDLPAATGSAPNLRNSSEGKTCMYAKMYMYVNTNKRSKY